MYLESLVVRFPTKLHYLPPPRECNVYLKSSNYCSVQQLEDAWAKDATILGHTLNEKERRGWSYSIFLLLHTFQILPTFFVFLSDQSVPADPFFVIVSPM
jgi:hypothetical protein